MAVSGALVMIALGLMGAIAPRLAARLVGIEPLGGFGLSEVRATYGGLFLAMGASCLYLQSPSAYALAGAAWTGAGLLRVISLILDKGSFPRAIGGIAVELGVGFLLLTGAGPGILPA